MDNRILYNILEGLYYFFEGDNKWIQKAIKKKGSLRELAKREGKINSRGNIDKDWLRKMAKSNTKTGRRARLALVLMKLRNKS